ncbi:sigma-70 family RNA polymerase sigma factor [Flavobacterium columnare]|uniref:Sigma-70 family RNA polymerase sigma factor n=1 Tax=Flavobacterium columnare TaxID=996 RepID=A0A437UD82_9FLAO|nr:sigma-70 family RNA polymerase sigma factor [Flavobacterium columnare]RVU91572.1 sigma-70 family RNA polymerase sigma factor [Flavobacterium columnare]
MNKLLSLIQITDKDLLSKIKEDSDNLSIVYKKCKNNSIRFLKKYAPQFNEFELEDIYQDAIIVLYEKIIDDKFDLNCSFQTYINAVCKNQLLNHSKKKNLTIQFADNNEIQDIDHTIPNIKDSLDEVENTNEPYFQAIEKALLKIKETGGHCYELLTLFWYHKKSMIELTEVFGYSNADNTKQQKAKCQKRLEKLAFNELNN